MKDKLIFDPLWCASGVLGVAAGLKALVVAMTVAPALVVTPVMVVGAAALGLAVVWAPYGKMARGLGHAFRKLKKNLTEEASPKPGFRDAGPGKNRAADLPPPVSSRFKIATRQDAGQPAAQNPAVRSRPDPGKPPGGWVA